MDNTASSFLFQLNKVSVVSFSFGITGPSYVWNRMENFHHSLLNGMLYFVSVALLFNIIHFNSSNIYVFKIVKIGLMFSIKISCYFYFTIIK